MTAVVFDLDGTLVDSVPDMHAALNRVLGARGHSPLPVESVRGFVGHGVPTLVRRAMAAVGKTGDDFDAWHDDYMARYAEGVCVETRLYAGALATINTLAAQGHRLGICTNKPQGLTEALLDALGIASRFDAVLGGDTPFGRKPDPRPLREVVRHLGGRPAVMIGDGAADVGAARAAGVPVLLYTGGYCDVAPETLEADAAFADWSDVPDLVTAIPGWTVSRPTVAGPVV